MPLVPSWHSEYHGLSALTDVVLVPARVEPVLHGPAVGGVDRGGAGGALPLHGRTGVDAAVDMPAWRTQAGVLKQASIVRSTKYLYTHYFYQEAL